MIYPPNFFLKTLLLVVNSKGNFRGKKRPNAIGDLSKITSDFRPTKKLVLKIVEHKKRDYPLHLVGWDHPLGDEFTLRLVT